MNTTLLREIAQGFLERPETLDMSYYTNHCGSVCCIAGEIVHRKHPKHFANYFKDDGPYIYWSELGAKGIGVSFSSAQLLFEPLHWPGLFRDRLNMEDPGTPAYASVVSDRIEHFITTEGRE